jgi:hypothetical protein
VSLIHNDRLTLLFDSVREGRFGPHKEVAAIFSGRADSPMQVALRDSESMTVTLIALNPDGSVDSPPRAA